MKAKDIVEQWLRLNGYDGLCTVDCGCELDDLMPCCEPDCCMDCEPGYKASCQGPEDCAADGDCPWHIVPTRPKIPTLEHSKDKTIKDAMRFTKGNQKEAAKLLGIPVRTMYRYTDNTELRQWIKDVYK